MSTPQEPGVLQTMDDYLRDFKGWRDLIPFLCREDPPEKYAELNSQNCDIDVYEYLASDIFWILGILIVINGIWTYRQLRAPSSASISYRILRFVISGIFVILLLLEGSAVVVTVWRFTVMTLKRTYPLWKPRILAFIAHLPMTAVLVIIWCVFLGLGCGLLNDQFRYLRRLSASKPGPQEAEEEGHELGEV